MHNFQIISKVGEGAFASVYKAKRKEDGQIYAMKKIKLVNSNTKEIANCLNQVRILASISNPYIIGYKEAIYDEQAKCLLLITEFAYGGDLSALVKTHQRRKQRVSETEVWRWAIQMLFGLRTLHRMNIFHRDIKSANVLLTQNHQEIKLADLNVSKIAKTGMASTQTGTPYYASPQVWSDLPYNAKCDIWSLGCVLYELCAFHPPFMANDINSLKKKITAGHYDRIPQGYSEDLESLIRLCLATNSRDRPSAQSLLHNPLIRRRLYMFPNEKFNESGYEEMLNKENKLLQTIKVSNRYNFGSDLKSRLPKSNYDNTSEVMQERNRSSSLSKNRSEERLPQLMKRNSSRDTVKEKINIPKPRLVYLR